MVGLRRWVCLVSVSFAIGFGVFCWVLLVLTIFVFDGCLVDCYLLDELVVVMLYVILFRVMV